MRYLSLALSLTILAAATAIALDARQQSTPEEQREGDRRQAEPYLRMRGEFDPDHDRDNWRPLGPDLGIHLYRDAMGSARGRLYVMQEGRWVPVAVDGLSDIGAPALPAR